MESLFEGMSFSANRGAHRILRHKITSLVSDRRANLDFLDIGCGDGQQIFDLAAELPNCRFVGLDISRANIERARAECARLGLEPRVQFRHEDYLESHVGAYDLILSTSVFHLMTDDSAMLFAKLRENLRCGGILLFTMPYRCVFNHILVLLRRLARAVRFKFVDQLLLRMAKLLHGRSFAEGFLSERVAYMYILPKFFWSSRTSDELKAMGLEEVECETVAQASVAQLKHVLVVYRRPEISSFLSRSRDRAAKADILRQQVSP